MAEPSTLPTECGKESEPHSDPCLSVFGRSSGYVNNSATAVAVFRPPVELGPARHETMTEHVSGIMGHWWLSIQHLAGIQAGSGFSYLLGAVLLAGVMLGLLPVLGRILGWVITLGLRIFLKKKSFSLSVGSFTVFPFRLVNLHIQSPVCGLPTEAYLYADRCVCCGLLILFVVCCCVVVLSFCSMAKSRSRGLV